jgi:predicted metal-dependent peptidase
MMKMTAAEERLASGRSSLLLSHVFFAMPALKIPTEITESVETASTDGRKFYYNPKYILSIMLDTLKTLIAHEVMHVLLKHHLRRGDRNAKLRNFACDYVVNIILVKAGFRLWDGALYDPQYEGLTAEQVYSRLYKPPQPDPEPETSPETEQPQDDEDQGDEEDNEPDTGGDQDQDEEDSQDDESGGDGAADGEAEGEEGGEDDEGEPADLSDFENVQDVGGVTDFVGEEGGEPTEDEKAEQESAVDISLVQAAQLAEAQDGGIPGELKLVMRDVICPELPYEILLERFMVHSARNGTTWMKPNRRFIGQGLYLPSRYSRDLGEVVLMVDTSGSIGEEILDTFGNHINRILGMHPSMTHVVYFDCEVQNVQQFAPDDEIKLEPMGGGWTSYVPAFEWVRDNEVYPTCIIVLTDGECSEFAPDPETPVLWVLNRANRLFHPPYGEVIDMEEK